MQIIKRLRRESVVIKRKNYIAFYLQLITDRQLGDERKKEVEKVV